MLLHCYIIRFEVPIVTINGLAGVFSLVEYHQTAHTANKTLYIDPLPRLAVTVHVWFKLFQL